MTSTERDLVTAAPAQFPFPLPAPARYPPSMVRWTPDDRAARLLQPVRAQLDRAAALLPDAPPLAVTVGTIADPGRFWSLDLPTSSDGLVVLSDLLESGIHHPLDADRPFGLDRWRRAAGAVLEAASTRELVRRTGKRPGPEWWWVGGAIHAADAVAPEFGLALPDLALAVATGSPGLRPRAGIAVMRAWQRAGIDPIRQVAYLLEGGVISPAEWAKLGQWVLGREGLAATLAAPVERATEAELGADGLLVAPWTWQPFRRPDDGRGAFLEVKGEGIVDPAWASAGQDLHAVASAAGSPVRITAGVGAPVGDWEVASAEGFGQVVGARGIRFSFRRDGRLEVVLADAFVGPLAALAMAEEVGTSGLCAGTWKVAGQRWLRFDGIDARSLTLHGRSRGGFLVPARGFGLAEWLGSLSEAPWAWQEGPTDRLVMRGRMRGTDVEVRLRKE